MLDAGKVGIHCGLRGDADEQRLRTGDVEPYLACEPRRNVAPDLDALGRHRARMGLVAVRVRGEVTAVVPLRGIRPDPSSARRDHDRAERGYDPRSNRESGTTPRTCFRLHSY